MNLKHIKRADHCLNCNQALDQQSDNFCPQCGQLNNTKKETASELLRELAGDFLHLDSKVTRTIIPLLFKPGYLTQQFNSGKRARYLHPVRMFISILIIFVIVRGTIGNSHESDQFIAGDTAITQNGTDKDTIITIGSTRSPLVITSTDSSKGSSSFTFRSNANFDKAMGMARNGITDVDVILDSLGKEKTFFNRVLFSRAIKMADTKNFTKDFRTYFRSKLPWVIFSLMPVFAFILWLLYIRKNFVFSEHLIYAFHLHSFFFLLIAIGTVFTWITHWSISWLLVIYIMIYLVMSMKKVYRQGYGKTIGKFILLSGAYLILGSLFFFTISAVLFLLY